MDAKTLGQRCRDFRKKHFMTMGMLADRCGVNKNTIYNIEHGITDPSIIVQGKIESVIGAAENAEEN